MAEPDPKTPSPRPPEDRRLDSWKEIAAYLNRDVTTAQRWEKREGMPVHRHLHDRAGSIYAFQSELDAWVRARSLRAAQESAATPATPEPRPVAPLKPAPRSPWAIWLPLTFAAAFAISLSLWLRNTEYFWRSPIADAQFQTVTDFDGVAQAAAISRDGHFAAFLSDRDGPIDVWVTQVGSGEFHNLTHGKTPELVNPSIRTLGFSPDGSAVTFWARRQGAANGSGGAGGDISIWAVPTLGGQPRPYLDGVAEYDWSHDASRLAYHTPGPGDPLYTSDSLQRSTAPPIFTAPSGLHSHFPLWSPDSKFIYFVQGTLPGKLDIWRIAPSGSTPERITTHNSRVTHPVFLDARTLMYVAGDPEGGGPWLHSMNVDRRISHRLSSGLDRYTSLAASADGRRLVATVSSTRRTLWRLPFSSENKSPDEIPPQSPTQIPIKTSSVFSPRQGPGYLLYASTAASGDSIWKLTNGTPTQLWTAESAHILGGPTLAPDGRIAFSISQAGRSLLYIMQPDGANARILTDTLDLQGAPTWAPDGQSITTAAEVPNAGQAASQANAHPGPHLFQVPLDGRPPTPFLQDYSLDPAWSPDGTYAVYSGPDIGTKFAVKSITKDAAPHQIPDLALTRGARHLAFLPGGGHSLVFLQGEIKHKNLWFLDLDTGAQHQLTTLPPDFEIRDFDLSPDGHDLVLERAQEHSEVVLLDLPHR